MISARKAWKISIDTHYDKEALKDMLTNVKYAIDLCAKYGKTSMEIPLSITSYVPERKLCVTYYKLLKFLRKKKYKANIQTETRYYINEDSELAKYLREHGKPVTAVPIVKTYLYVSWERKNK